MINLCKRMWCNQSWQICTKLCWMAKMHTKQNKPMSKCICTIPRRSIGESNFDEDVGCMQHSLQHTFSGIPPLPASLHRPYPWPWLCAVGTFCHLFHPCASSPRPHPCPHTDASDAAAADPCLALCLCPFLPSCSCHPPTRRSGGSDMLDNIQLLRCLHADCKDECRSVTMAQRLLQRIGPPAHLL